MLFYAWIFYWFTVWGRLLNFVLMMMITPLFVVVSRAILMARAASPADVSGHPIVKVCSFINRNFKWIFIPFGLRKQSIQERCHGCVCLALCRPRIGSRFVDWPALFISSLFFLSTSMFMLRMLHHIIALFWVFLIFSWFRNLIKLHKRESASEHYPWSSLKQSTKREKMLRFKFHLWIF